MSRTYTLTPTGMYGGRGSRNMYLSGFTAWETKRVGYWQQGSTNYLGAVSFFFDFAPVIGRTIESIKLTTTCSGTFAYSVPLLYSEKSTDSVTDWTIPDYSHEVQVSRYGTIPQLDLTVFGIPSTNAYVIGSYYRTYASVDITGATLTIVTAETYKTVTYNANGGTGAPSPTQLWGEGDWDDYLSTTEPTRTGYRFEGWNTQQNGGGTHYDAGQYIQASADIILYAEWTALSSVLDSVTDAEIGQATTVSWTNYGSFVNKLRFIFGSADTGEIAVSGTSHQFTLPSTWYAQTPTSTSGTATVYLYTYVDGVLIGTSSLTFTVSVGASVVPSIGSVTATGIDEVWGLLLQEHSSVTITAANCAPGAGSTIAKYSIVGEGLDFSATSSDPSASATSGIFAVSGSLTYTVTVQDARGRTATGTVMVNVTAYARPSISSVDAVRCNADGTLNPITGTTIRAVAVFTYSQVGQNILTSELSYKRHADSVYTTAQTNLTSGTAYIIAVGTAEIASSYDVKVEIVDALGNSASFVDIVPPVVGISFGLKNDRARFGGPVEGPGLQIDWNTKIQGTLTLGNTTLTEAQLQSLLSLL